MEGNKEEVLQQGRILETLKVGLFTGAQRVRGKDYGVRRDRRGEWGLHQVTIWAYL